MATEGNSLSTSSMTCGLAIDWLNQQKSVVKKVKCKTASLELVRNEFRDLFIKVISEQVKLKLLVNNLTIHKKFVSEGKASINFNESKVVMYISNAPLSGLVLFLKTLFIKMTSRKSSPKVPLKEKLLSNKPNFIQEVSPVNPKDIGRVKKETGLDTRKQEILKKRRIEESHETNQVCCPSDFLNETCLSLVE